MFSVAFYCFGQVVDSNRSVIHDCGFMPPDV